MENDLGTRLPHAATLMGQNADMAADSSPSHSWAPAATSRSPAPTPDALGAAVSLRGKRLLRRELLRDFPVTRFAVRRVAGLGGDSVRTSVAWDGKRVRLGGAA
jgi:hypothetical protein